MNGLHGVLNLLGEVSKLTDKGAQVGKMIEAGTALARVVRSNVEEAAATMTESDAAKLRERADELAMTNRALSEQLDAALK